MKKTLLISVVCAVAAAGAVEWKGLDDANHLGGSKITAADLLGKVVLVDEWGKDCPPCKALLPELQKYWTSFASKGFVLLGSHRQQKDVEAIKKILAENKVTYPVYQGAGIVDAPRSRSLPHMYVINHRGDVIYNGRSSREAIEKVQDALMAKNLPPSLIGNTELKKFKSLAQKLVLGKNISSVQKQLERIVKKSKDSDQVAEAQSLLTAMEEAKRQIGGDIELMKRVDPENALRLVTLYIKTWPRADETKAFKGELRELRAAAKEFKKAKKAKQ